MQVPHISVFALHGEVQGLICLKYDNKVDEMMTKALCVICSTAARRLHL